ncbi:MAG: CinA family protein [Verrucomicrobia bacterium]|nr:CinA family protein [Verrucomicrobiota bacterium]
MHLKSKFLLPTWTLLLGSLALTNLVSHAGTEGTEPSARTKPLEFVIVVTGGELLEGAYPDGHTHFITRTLRPLGCQCVGSIIVDDQREAICAGLRFATNRAPLVIVTGGLGPTPNDITRDVLSEFTGIALAENARLLADMERRFNQTRDQLRPNLRRQTRVPVRGEFLKNSNGSAAGLVFDSAPSVIVALPGPPRELQPMVRSELVPFLRQRFGVRDFGASRTLRFVGAGQSLIDQTIKDHVAVAPDVMITSLFEGSRVDFTFSLPGNTPDDQARLKRLEQDIREHLEQYLYADDGATLEEVVAQKIRARGGALVLAEVGSGGHLAAALSSVTGADTWLAGSYEAPTAQALGRLLRLPESKLTVKGVEGARQMAAAASELTGSRWALAVGPVEVDAAGAKQVWVAVKLPGEVWDTQRYSLRDTGEASRSSLTTQILDRLRRVLK